MAFRYPDDYLNSAQVADLLLGHVKANIRSSVLVLGENGVGKTAIQHSLRKRDELKDHLFVTFDAGQASVGDIRVPIPNKELGITQNMPNELFGLSLTNRRGVNNSRPVVLCLDELIKAPKPVLTSLSPVFYDWRCGTLEYPDGSLVWATSNLAVEGLGDMMAAHTRNRITVVRMRKPTFDEWATDFAVPAGIEEEILAWGYKEPRIFESFLSYMPGGPKNGQSLEKDNEYIFNPKIAQESYVSPRSLARASNKVRMNKLGYIDDTTMTQGLIGDIGVEGAKALAAFIRFGRDIPTYDEVIADPKGCRLSNNPAAQVVQTFQFVTNTENRTNAAKVTEYVLRMRDEMQSMFAYTVSRNRNKLAHFLTVTEFVRLMDRNQIYFSN